MSLLDNIKQMAMPLWNDIEYMAMPWPYSWTHQVEINQNIGITQIWNRCVHTSMPPEKVILKLEGRSRLFFPAVRSPSQSDRPVESPAFGWHVRKGQLWWYLLFEWNMVTNSSKGYFELWTILAMTKFSMVHIIAGIPTHFEWSKSACWAKASVQLRSQQVKEVGEENKEVCLG